MSENIGKCVTIDATRKVKFEKSKDTGNIEKVFYVTHKQRCSTNPAMLKLEEDEELEGEAGENGAPPSDVAQTASDEAGQDLEEEDNEDMELIKETFKRYLKDII